MTRYAHAQWDPAHNAFIHFDGAIKQYAKARYPSRLQCDRPRRDEEAKPDYRKLFRINGTIPLDTWAELISVYFKDNELIFEFVNTSLAKPATEMSPM